MERFHSQLSDENHVFVTVILQPEALVHTDRLQSGEFACGKGICDRCEGSAQHGRFSMSKPNGLDLSCPPARATHPRSRAMLRAWLSIPKTRSALNSMELMAIIRKTAQNRPWSDVPRSNRCFLGCTPFWQPTPAANQWSVWCMIGLFDSAGRLLGSVPLRHLGVTP